MGQGTSTANIYNIPGAEGDMCNPNVGNTVGDIFGGVANGVLNMVGLGFFVDPIGPLQDQISEASAKLQAVYNNDGLQFAKNQEKINQFLMEVMNTKSAVLQEMLAINTEITNENLGRVDIALASIGVLVLVIVIYLLLQPS